MQEFNLAIGGDAAEHAFQAWRKCYPESFVINQVGSKLTLHVAKCGHLVEKDPNRRSTEHPKYCTRNWEEIGGWASAQDIQAPVPCKDCKPGSTLSFSAT